ncbi:fluoride efflux transporter CrcB [Lentibacillus salicampi]|uniref:Fluoride-specific ion channel FluC n=1 Tax=Lentibacillus salicampi TaxID=175306 RepID=A0A4Y9A7X8_9BACI|nr:fluoride efflux transporter CrcB [Lentibacillus salicampi]TFJ91896.1 fluoride efflux transporter CrcB [Lentibacillus salicampi]
MHVLLVMAGGFFGAIARYALGEWIVTSDFPLNMLVINLMGCFFLGWFLTFVSQRANIRPEVALLIGTGFTGSFTTFSTFSLETFQLFQEGLIVQGVLYIMASMIGGVLMACAGFKLAVAYSGEGRGGG